MEKKYFETVRVEDEMPPKGKKVSVSFDNGDNFSYEALGKGWKSSEVNYTHWLKEIPAPVSPKVSDDLEKMADDRFCKEYDRNDDKRFDSRSYKAFVKGFKAAQSNDVNDEMVDKKEIKRPIIAEFLLWWQNNKTPYFMNGLNEYRKHLGFYEGSEVVHLKEIIDAFLSK